MKKESTFSKIWQRIETLAIILIIWTLLTTLLPLSEYVGNRVVSIFTWVIQLGAFAFLGYQVQKDNQNKIPAAKYGAYLGAILGLFFAVIAILSFYLFPEAIQQTINQAVQQGADIETVELFVKIGLYFNLILTPLLTGAIGALITWLSSLITKEATKKK